ncbi:uncharacterized protein F4812DRAFT_463022 [Daldinia caldariorum]|uniref:uncharacterized protein n=1 Tax=Daldinia caldariorum TaxID=326644 RepID=UPI00200886C7|nr:uncharacterized protein F4812DRAFT_463022 [Daldinia caldariorum]KAI1464271.1 hypothetical protein F4812DRAFT_463022 [Daldinia caldariorum]
MDVQVGPSSTAFALSGFPYNPQQLQANPRAMQFPATAATTPAIPGASINGASINGNYFPFPNSSSNPSSNTYEPSTSDLLQQHSPNPNNQQHLNVGEGTRMMRKRKAESQDNERLSKRLSLLNLEQNGQKLYVPVESPKLRPTECNILKQIPENDSMQLDDSKHKVYIYNLDDELSDAESDTDGRLIFIPDIEKHLMQTRIPPSVLASKDGEFAGMQLVLYREPTSLTIPEEQDNVRRAIIEARQRARDKQKEKSEQSTPPSNPPASLSVPSSTAPDPSPFNEYAPFSLNGFANHNGAGLAPVDDPDAMEMD